MSTGWVMLHRQLLQWEWYDDINTSRLFIHCLLRANHSDNKWRGIDIKRGSFLTSLESLSKETHLTVSQIRTSLKKLISTGELTSKSQARNRVITILEYNRWQADSSKIDKLVASSSQDDSRVVTTNNNVNKENNDKEDQKNLSTKVDFSVFLMDDDQLLEVKRIRTKNSKTKKGAKFTDRIAKSLAEEFFKGKSMGFSLDEMLNEWETRSWTSFKADWMPNKSNGKSIIDQSADEDWHKDLGI